MNTPQWNERIKALADSVRDKPIIRVKPDKVAVIVEPRITQVLPDLLTWMIYLLSPYGWTFVVYCGTTNEHLLKDFDVKVQKLDKDNLTVKNYNDLFISRNFWESMPFENILIFQTDCVLIDGNLNEFLHYDYVGAPWVVNELPMLPIIRSLVFRKGLAFGIKTDIPKYMTGNGGLSLRKKSAMLRALKNVPYDNNSNEDIYYSVFSRRYINFPPAEIAMKFSVESVFYPHTKGFHACWKYLGPQCMEWIYAKLDSVSKTN